MQDFLDREAIRETMARYTIAGDRLREEDFIACFTADAIMESEHVPEADAFRYQGRDAIRHWISRWSDAPKSAHQATFVRHHLTTSLIELTGSASARGRTYWIAYTDIGADHAGYYLDEFRKEGGAWLIAHRRVRLDWRAPNSLFSAVVANTRG